MKVWAIMMGLKEKREAAMRGWYRGRDFRSPSERHGEQRLAPALVAFGDFEILLLVFSAALVALGDFEILLFVFSAALVAFWFF